MMFSQDRIAYLARTIVAETKKEKLLEYRDESMAYTEIKRVIENYFTLYNEVYDAVIKKLASYSKPIMEGTTEYNLLFKKFYDEELNKRGIYG